MGLKDGQEGQRLGQRWDFWKKDCAALGVSWDRQRYNDGYVAGLGEFCSCEKGFDSGIREEYIETKAQFYTCQKDQFISFSRGHGLAKPFVDNPSLSKKINPYKIDYLQDAIAAKAKESCALK